MRGRRDDSASSGDRAPAGPHDGPAIGKHTRVESLSDPSVQRFVQSSEPAISGRSETPQREPVAAFIGATAGLVPVETVAIRATEAVPKVGESRD